MKATRIFKYGLRTTRVNPTQVVHTPTSAMNFLCFPRIKTRKYDFFILFLGICCLIHIFEEIRNRSIQVVNNHAFSLNKSNKKNFNL